MATQDELSDLRKDIGDVNNAFSEAELDRLFIRAEEYGAVGRDRHWVAMALAILQITTQAARFNDYVLTDNQERRAQVFAQMQAVLTDLKEIPAVNKVLGATAGDAGKPVFGKMKYANSAMLSGEYTRG